MLNFFGLRRSIQRPPLTSRGGLWGSYTELTREGASVCCVSDWHPLDLLASNGSIRSSLTVRFAIDREAVDID